MTHTFKIRPDMKWSDGEPATSEDARYTYQLVLDGVASERGYIGSGYLEPYLTNAGIKTVTAPDPLTLVVTTEFPTTLLTQAYVPILPKHIWSKYTLDQIADPETADFFKNEPTIVGTGPYQVVEWEPGNFVRFEANPNYWGTKGAANEVIIQHFASTDTMVQALRRGEVDYVRGVGADQFDALANEPNIKPVEGFANGYTYLSFNTKGNTKGYGGSTSALIDPKFRDALGYAIDNAKLVDATLAGHGVPGTTNVPPYHANFHVEPTTPRRFDIAEADRRLVAAGYDKDAAGKRLDKDGKAINLRLTWPDSEAENATNAQFIQGWFAELGIGVEAAVTEEGKLSADLIGPPDGPANWDFYMWGWVGDPDPDVAAVLLHVGGPRRHERQLLHRPALRRAVRAPAEGHRRERTEGLHRGDAADLLRQRAVHRPVLRLRAARLPDRQVRRLGEPAARDRHAAVRLRPDRLHAADTGHGGVAIAVGRGIGARRAERFGGDAGAVRQARRATAPAAAHRSCSGPGSC